MAIITYPLNNIEYTAEDAELYHATRTSGVFANDDFPITVSGDGNVVTIGEGIGWIRNSKFSGKVVANKSEMSLDLGLPHATYPRIDAVVLQFNANANASEIIVKNGTAQTNPMPPEVIRTESVYELHLYHVYREAGAASVIASNVTDLRSYSAYCGIMSDDVTMLGDDYVKKNTVGVANGVASLDGSGKVPEAQLPSMDYIPTSQKAAANGVASLGSDGKVPSGQLNLSSSVSSTSTTTLANSYAVKQAYDKAAAATTRPDTQIFPVTVSNVQGASNVTIENGIVYTATHGDIMRCYIDFRATVGTDNSDFTFDIEGLPLAYCVLGVSPATAIYSNAPNVIAGVCFASRYSNGGLGLTVKPIDLTKWASGACFRVVLSYVKL